MKEVFAILEQFVTSMRQCWFRDSTACVELVALPLEDGGRRYKLEVGNTVLLVVLVPVLGPAECVSHRGEQTLCASKEEFVSWLLEQVRSIGPVCAAIRFLSGEVAPRDG